MFGLQLCLSSLGLDVHSDMAMLGNDMSSPELSGLSLDVQADARLSSLAASNLTSDVRPEFGYLV